MKLGLAAVTLITALPMSALADGNRDRSIDQNNRFKTALMERTITQHARWSASKPNNLQNGDQKLDDYSYTESINSVSGTVTSSNRFKNNEFGN